jgi:hypothetical protein
VDLSGVDVLLDVEARPIVLVVEHLAEARRHQHRPLLVVSPFGVRAVVVQVLNPCADAHLGQERGAREPDLLALGVEILTPAGQIEVRVQRLAHCGRKRQLGVCSACTERGCQRQQARCDDRPDPVPPSQMDHSDTIAARNPTRTLRRPKAEWECA